MPGTFPPATDFKLPVSDHGTHHGTCVTHVPWCMSGSLACGDGENGPGIPGVCAPAILRIWQEAHGVWLKCPYNIRSTPLTNNRKGILTRIVLLEVRMWTISIVPTNKIKLGNSQRHMINILFSYLSTQQLKYISKHTTSTNIYAITGTNARFADT